ncbi:prepilin peptidase [candidate division WWE3 bacterium]|nr:prepilin peptidase [candidate division WWE3 bacterium]
MITLIGFFGLFVGSFLNVIIERLPVGEQFFYGRSRCDACKRSLQWYEMIPLLSFLVLGGKCKTCHAVLSWQYPLLELSTGILFVVYYLFNQLQLYVDPITFVMNLFFISTLIILTVIDIKHGIIPDELVVANCAIFFLGTVLRLIFAITMGVALYPGAFILPFLSSITSAVLAGMFFYSIVWITKGKGMGGGDVKLAFAMGLILGHPQTLIAIYVSFIIGGFYAVILLISGKKRFGQTIPFGPFLALGGYIALLWGERLLQLYLTMFTRV